MQFINFKHFVSQFKGPRTFWKNFSVCAIVMAFSMQTSGQSWTIFNKSNSGLPGNQVITITPDSTGKKFFGTQYGLAIYDEGSWEVYKKSNSGLPGNAISDIAIDHSGDKWVGTSNNGLAIFDGNNWKVYDTNNSKIPGNIISNIKIDESGNKWIGTVKNGAAYYDGNSWEVYDTANSDLPGNRIYDFSIGESGDVWMCTNAGLVKFNGNSWQVYNTTNSGLPGNNNVYSIAIDQNGNKWIGTEYGGIARFDGSSWKVFDEDKTGSHVSSIALDQDGNKWIGTFIAGLAKYDGNSWTTYSKSNSKLPGDYILEVNVDNANNVWVATQNGVAKIGSSSSSILEPHVNNSGAIKAYPNPADEKLSINLKANSQFHTFKLQSLTGRTLQRGKLQGKSRQTLDVSDLTPGAYLLQLEAKEKVRMKKVIIK